MKNYIVLDLETPNRLNNSMCSIGIVVVENNEIVDEIYTLINPESDFDDFNIAFTGIGPEDVVNKPTFEDFWNEYEKLVTGNLIVGQNITFDLNVISKALTRYNRPIPSFNYYCTLSSSKRNLNLADNSLSYIVKNVLQTTYNAHNAMADAQMTYEFFNYLENYEKDRNKHIKTYYFRPNCKRDFDRSMDINYNYLYGLLQKFTYINQLTDNHYKLIETWYDSNNYENNHPLIQNMLLKVRYILENKQLSTKQMRNITQSLKPILRSPEYKAPRLKLEILRGLIDSIVCEDELFGQDIEFLGSYVLDAKINDKNFKKFFKELDWSDDDLKDVLSAYSTSLQDYI